MKIFVKEPKLAKLLQKLHKVNAHLVPLEKSIGLLFMFVTSILLCFVFFTAGFMGAFRWCIVICINNLLTRAYRRFAKELPCL